MSTLPAFKINGVIDTSKTVLSNLDVLCRASGCWLTYDSTTALWSVIINRAGASTKSFTDANIIGAINITGTGIDQLYNSVEVTYPDQDLQNNQDTVNFSIADANRLPNELDKKLSISLDCVNNQIQAAYIGIIELNQNRVDKIIQFKTDFRSLGLRAGDLIDITSTMYGYTSKVFRVTKIAEDDEDDGNIQLSITALEYDAGVYEQGSLVYTAKTTATGIVPKSANTALTGLDKATQTNVVYDFTASPILITGSPHTDPFLVFKDKYQSYDLNASTVAPYTGKYRIQYNINWAISAAAIDDEYLIPNTIRKQNGIGVKINGSFYNNNDKLGTTTIVRGEDPNADIQTTADFRATKGDSLTFFVAANSDLTNNSPGVSVAVSSLTATYPGNWKISNLGTTTQTQWNQLAGTTGVTYAVGTNFLMDGTTPVTGTGTFRQQPDTQSALIVTITLSYIGA